MRRSSVVALLIVAAIAAGVVQGGQPVARAQDATPASTPQAGADDAAVFRPLAAGSVEVLAPGVANLVLGRLTLAPGASIPFDPTDPSAVLMYVASGELTFRVDVPMTVARAAGPGTPTPPEGVAADAEFALGDGDAAIFPGSMGGEVRNDGAAEATAWLVDAAFLAAGAGTPTP